MKKLFFPLIREKCGTGHIRRCAGFVLSDPDNSFLFVHRSDRAVLKKLNIPLPEQNITESLEKKRFDLVVFDRKESLLSEIEKFKEIAPVAALDEGGKWRNSFLYLIDTLAFPKDKKHIPGNIFSSGFLDVQEKKKFVPGKIENILVAFGGEDPAGLTGKFLEYALPLLGGKKVIVAKGGLFKGSLPEGDYDTAENPPSLLPFIEKADLVITSFGITAYESLYAGKRILLLDPGRYHSRLSKAAGFPEIGIGRPDCKKLKSFLSGENYPAGIFDTLGAKRSLVGFLDTLDFSKKYDLCPLCGSSEVSVISRHEYKNYSLCGKCGIVYKGSFDKTGRLYDKNYFFCDYKRQYGKTYLEDFENLKKMAQRRADIIKKYGEGKHILDVGCAYGAFLSVMKEEGFRCEGVEISSDAALYVKDRFGIPVFRGDYEKEFTPDGKFDIITMWFVIEHFENIGEILKKTGRLLKRGGLFCFASPNRGGISGKSDEKGFYLKSPDDHYTVWDAASAGKALGMYGFEIAERRITGHHPERFPSRSFLNPLKSRLFSLGDTFEIYAKKTAEF